MPTTDPETGVTTWVIATNDPAYWSSAGYTPWARNDASHAAGYGILFGYASGPTMLVVMITLQDQYCVGEVVEGLFQMVLDWTAFPHLNATEACCSFEDTADPYQRRRGRRIPRGDLL